MTSPKSPVERLLDLALYAPIGLAVAARDQLPELIEKGRHFLATELNAPGWVSPPAASDAGGQTQPRRPAPSASADRDETPSANGSVPSAVNTAPSGAHLAIPGYDTLSASQVVQRLAGLAADELEAVREYETTTRGRRTILAKIGQLQSGAS